MLKITPFIVLHQQNQYVESFLTYLNSRLPAKNPIMNQPIVTPKNFISNSKEITLRLETDGSDLRDINYACLAEEDDSILRYYFISSKIKVSEYIYDITFTLDVVNTYQSQITNSANFKNVKVLRQHKDRWIKSNDTYFRIYDKVDEGLGELSQDVYETQPISTTESYCVTKGFTDLETDLSKDGAYLLGNMALRKSLVLNTNASLNVSIYASTLTLTSSSLSAKILGLIMTDSNDDFVKVNESIEGIGQRNAIGNCIAFYSLSLMVGIYDSYNLTFTPTEIFNFNNAGTTNFEITGTGDFTIRYRNDFKGIWNAEIGRATKIINLLGDYKIQSSTKTTQDFSPLLIGNINKVDSNVKQIQSIPFIPDNLVLFNNEILITDDVSKYSTTYGIYDNFTSSLPLYSYGTRIRDFESKLMGSYVSKRQICYDTFALPILPEYYKSNLKLLNLSFYKPNDMSNDFAIKCDSLKQHTFNDNVITCSRNNEVTIYSNEYLEYLRNGYNYDSKNQCLNKLKTSIGIVAGLTGTGIGTYNSIKNASTATSGVLAGQMVGTAVSTIGSLISTGISESQNDMALEEKRRQMLIATPAMSGSNSIDLFKELNGGNTIKYVFSQPREAILDSLWNLFYFYGYADNKLYDQMPSLFTRRYFNFIQAEVGVCQITDPIIRNYLIEAYKDGITFCFKYNNEYLFLNYKLYENWERSLN